MQYLAVVTTVTDAAAICDHLQADAGADDAVHALTVHPPDAQTPDSDRREALNVVGVRLALPAVETEARRGPVSETVAAVLDDSSPDDGVVPSPDAGESSSANEVDEVVVVGDASLLEALPEDVDVTVVDAPATED